MTSLHEQPSQELWSARIAVTSSKDSFVDTLRQTAEEQNFTFFGFFIFDTMDKAPTSYHFTRYPRIKYGIRSIEECNRALVTLTQNLTKSTMIVAPVIEDRESLEPYKFRVILGLREGYNPQNLHHTKEEATEHLGNDYAIKEAELYALGKDHFYTEPAIMILGKDDLPKVYQLAVLFRQERFIVENFGDNTSYVTEIDYNRQD